MDIDIPGYKVKSVLGKGGMATVYLAEQTIFERDVALKVMNERFSEDPAFGKRFLREAKIVSGLSHPNIVKLYDVGKYENHYFITMEYVNGPDFKAANDQLTLAQKLSIIREVAAALAYAGGEGIVHRDIKAENILLREPAMEPVLMDFGIARAVESELSVTQTGTSLGTPHYMSPEQARGEAVDPRSDLYSLGVVLYYALTGAVPYKGDSAVSVGIKHITQPVPRLPEQLALFQEAIDKLMAKSAAHRFQTAAQFIDYLDQLELPESLQSSGTVSHADASTSDSEADMPSRQNTQTIDTTMVMQRNWAERFAHWSAAMWRSKNSLTAASICAAVLLCVWIVWPSKPDSQQGAKSKIAVANAEPAPAPEPQHKSVANEELGPEIEAQDGAEPSIEVASRAEPHGESGSELDLSSELDSADTPSETFDSAGQLTQAPDDELAMNADSVSEQAEIAGESDVSAAELDAEEEVGDDSVDTIADEAAVWALLPRLQAALSNTSPSYLNVTRRNLERSINRLKDLMANFGNDPQSRDSLEQDLESSLQDIIVLLHNGEFEDAQWQYAQTLTIVPEIPAKLSPYTQKINAFIADIPTLRQLNAQASQALALSHYTEPQQASAVYYYLKMMQRQPEYRVPISASAQVLKGLRQRAEKLYSDGRWGQSYQYARQMLVLSPRDSWALEATKTIEDYQRQVNRQKQAEYSQADK